MLFTALLKDSNVQDPNIIVEHEKGRQAYLSIEEAVENSHNEALEDETNDIRMKRAASNIVSFHL